MITLTTTDVAIAIVFGVALLVAVGYLCLLAGEVRGYDRCLYEDREGER